MPNARGSLCLKNPSSSTCVILPTTSTAYDAVNRLIQHQHCNNIFEALRSTIYVQYALHVWTLTIELILKRTWKRSTTIVYPATAPLIAPNYSRNMTYRHTICAQSANRTLRRNIICDAYVFILLRQEASTLYFSSNCTACKNTFGQKYGMLWLLQNISLFLSRALAPRIRELRLRSGQ